MKIRIKIYQVLLILVSIFIFSCEESSEGYIEVRNKSEFIIENVSWGNNIYLGTFNPNQEKGMETEFTGNTIL